MENGKFPKGYKRRWRPGQSAFYFVDGKHEQAMDFVRNNGFKDDGNGYYYGDGYVVFCKKLENTEKETFAVVIA